jgi:hypothetical protein
VSVCGSKNTITLKSGVDNLTDDVLVGNTDNESVLGSIVLVLVLNNQALASIVVSLAGTATTVLDLVALEVRAVLNDFQESHDCVGLGDYNRLQQDTNENKIEYKALTRRMH